MSDGHPIRTGVLTGILTGVALAVLAELFGWIDITGWLKAGCGWLSQSSSHPRWLLFLLWLSFAAWAITVLVAIIRRSPPAYLQYRQDDFFGMRWRWRYFEGKPFAATPFCPTCDLQIIPTQVGGSLTGQITFDCPECNTHYQTFDHTNPTMVQQDAHLRVERNIRQNFADTPP